LFLDITSKLWMLAIDPGTSIVKHRRTQTYWVGTPTASFCIFFSKILEFYHGQLEEIGLNQESRTWSEAY
jgi:hypothetical protein